MSTGFSLYFNLWTSPKTADSASFDTFPIIDYFVPSGTLTVSGTSIYTLFPSQSFTNAYAPFNPKNVIIGKYTIANYSITSSIDLSTNALTVKFYPYISFYPGRVDNVTFGLQYEIDFYLSYSLDWSTHSWPNQQPYLRTGLYINGTNGSPQINIQTTTSSIVLPMYIAGDFFYSASDGYYINFEDSPRKLLTMRTHENIGRYGTIENPYNTIFGVHSTVTDNFLQTILGVSSDITGTLWKNTNWDGGLYMPDSNTVSIYGNQQRFLVSSGNFIASQSVTSSNITFNKTAISWSINPIPTDLTRIALEFRNSNITIPNYVSITDPSASMLVIGESASVQINGAVVNNIFMYSGSVSLGTTTNGVIQMYSASGASGSNLGYMYMSGAWYTILTGSDFYPTLSNGTY